MTGKTIEIVMDYLNHKVLRIILLYYSIIGKI